LLNESCRLDRTWLKFYERSFGAAPRRTIIDYRLSVFHLFSRKKQRRLFKRGNPSIQELTFQVGATTTSSSSSSPSSSSSSSHIPLHSNNSNATTSALRHGEHRTRSRGGSTDLSILIPVSQQLASAAASESGVGAVRFVLMTRHKIVIASTDQGHVFSSLLQPIHSTQSSIGSSTKRVVTPANIQTDAFAHAIGAKARRDAKRKYAGRGSSQESSLVYFKINASRQGKQGFSTGTSNGPGTLSQGGSCDDAGDDRLDFWDPVQTSPQNIKRQTSSNKIKQALQLIPPIDCDIIDNGDTYTNISRDDIVSSQSVDSTEDISVKFNEQPSADIVDELVLWESGLKDPLQHKQEHNKWRGGMNRSRQGSMNGSEDDDLCDSTNNPKQYLASGRSSVGKGGSGAERPRGKDLWSAADRAKLEEKQNKKNKKAAEKQAALEADAASRAAAAAATAAAATSITPQSQTIQVSSSILNLPESVSMSAFPVASNLSNRNTLSPSAFSKKLQKVSSSIPTLDSSPDFDGDVPSADFLANALLQGAASDHPISSSRKNSFQKSGNVSPTMNSPGSPPIRNSKEKISSSFSSSPSSALLINQVDESPCDTSPFLVVGGDKPDSLLVVGGDKPDSLSGRSFSNEMLATFPRKASMSIAVARMERSLVRDFVLDSGIGVSIEGVVNEDDDGGKPTSLKRNLEKKLKAKEKRAERIQRETARNQARNGSRFASVRTATQGTVSSNSTPVSPTANPASPISAGSTTPPNNGSSSPIPFSLSMGSSPGSRPPSPPSTATASGASAQPRGSQLRSDVWIACQWVRHETQIMRRWVKSAQGISSSSSSTSSSSLSTSLSSSLLTAPPRPLGTGESITYFNVVAFADGTLGVLAPSSISKHPHDSVLVGSLSGHVAGAGSKIATQGPQVAIAQHLMQQSKSSKNSGIVSKWLQRGVTWLERPPGEERERVAAVCVCKGRHFDSESGQSVLSNGGDSSDVELISDVEGDLIFAAFGRVVGCWLYGTPHGQAFDSDEISTEKRHFASKNEPREGAVSPGATSPIASGTAISVSDRKAKTGRKGKQSTDMDYEGINDETISSSSLASPSLTISGSFSSSSVNPAVLDSDRTLEPFGILRVHSHLVTSLSCWRKRLSAASFAAQIYYGGSQVCIPTPRYPSLVAIVSGDAGGDIVLWHVAEVDSVSNDLANASPLTKVAVMQLRGGGASREGVTCLSMDGDFIVAGGSEGTVTIWRRRFGNVPSSSPLSTDLSPISVVELAPELLHREHRAHSIVRLVATPSGRSLVSAVLSGGGEGDVRLWMIPPSPGSSLPSSRVTGAKISIAVSQAISTAAHESKSKWAEAKGYSSPSSNSSAQMNTSNSSNPTSSQLPAPTLVHIQCKVLRGHTSRITSLHMDNCILISLSLDGAIKVWDLQEPHLGGMLFTARLPDAREASSLSCAGTDVAIGSVDGHVFVYSFGMKKHQSIPAKEVVVAPVTSALDNLQMGAINSADRDRDVRMINLESDRGFRSIDLGGGDENGDLTAFELQQLYDAL